jgi:hypothetical protein
MVYSYRGSPPSVSQTLCKLATDADCAFRWEKYLPKTGQVFENAIKHLRQKGIARLSPHSGTLVERLIFLRVQGT